jgi:hypothetical protein
MLKTFEQATQLIQENKLLHISGAETLLRRLPKGNWIGGSTEYFMDETGGKVTDAFLDVRELDFATFKFAAYDAKTLPQIAKDAYSNGFSIIILPFDSAVHRQYAKEAANYQDIFLKSIAGWVSGSNLSAGGQNPIAVNGRDGGVFTDKAAVLHVSLPASKTALINIINIFTPNHKSPLITFDEEGFAAKKCRVNGAETIFADYIRQNYLDTQLPLIGDYAGAGINISIKNVENGQVNLYAPVFKNIDYRFAAPIVDYAATFRQAIEKLSKANVFSCNCILNFLYGKLEGKNIGGFYGPVTFGEIAWQLVNQTLVYLEIRDSKG